MADWEVRELRTVAEALLFDFGRAVLGKNSGGMIKNLLRERGIDGARVVIKMAADKSAPREYVGAALRDNKGEDTARVGDRIGKYWWNGDRWAEDEG